MENQEIEALKSTVIRLENELVAKSKKLNLYEIYLIITLLLIILNLFLVIYFFKQRPTGRPILQASSQKEIIFSIKKASSNNLWADRFV